jgi:sulfite reductase (NADPH) flavoprotein alpha-component
MLENRKLSPKGYNRDVRHYEFDIKDKKMGYGSGDCLSIFSHNKKNDVWQFLDKIGVNPNSTLDISTKDGSKLIDLPN